MQDYSKVLRNDIRVRFAPSPTGHLHIGGLRTALFNWLFAHHYKGTFLLRIEDTDVERSKAEYTQSILDALAWVSINSDEPIVMQSAFVDVHRKYANQLVSQGKAYRCYCPRTEYSEGDYGRYKGTCRNLSSVDADDTRPYAIRLKVDLSNDAMISFHDLVRGPLSFNADQLDDFIIVRSDQTPVYNFVVVIDDIAMRISHVIRGEEHISNTPRQILLYQALDAFIPHFAHLPMILGPDGTKLSKRQGATSVDEYQKMGYLPAALCNYLVRLGWAHGDQEIFTALEMINFFTLEAVGSKGAIFDQAKLDWVNSVYVRASDSDYLLQTILQYVEPRLLEKCKNWSRTALIKLIGLYKERVKTLQEMVSELVALYELPRAYDPEGLKLLTSQVEAALHEVIVQLSLAQIVDSQHIQILVKDVAQRFSMKLSEIAQPLRNALTGKTASPGIFELISILGKDESLKRLELYAAQRPP